MSLGERTVGAAAFGALLIAGCARASTPAAPTPPPRAAADASAPPALPPPATVNEPAATDAAMSSPPEEPCRPFQWAAGACWSGRRLGTPIDISAIEWLTQHGAKKLDEGRFQRLGLCHELRAGPDREEALLCEYGFGTDAGVALAGLQITTVREGRPVVLLDALDFMDGMPVVPPDPSDPPTGPLFALAIDTSNVANEIRFTLPKATACAEARSHVDHEDPSAKGEPPEVRKRLAKSRLEMQKYIAQICANATTFAWSRGTYERRTRDAR